jgi:hypothetical protein
VNSTLYEAFGVVNSILPEVAIGDIVLFGVTGVHHGSIWRWNKGVNVNLD